MNVRPFAIYHEHPDWFRPLFAELERRGIPFVRLDPRAHCTIHPRSPSPYSLLFNRMCPSAYLRGGVQGMFFTLGFLAHLERLGMPVVNGLEGLRDRDLQGAATHAARIARPAITRRPASSTMPRTRWRRARACASRSW